jgi:hypothetical protein
MIRKIYQTRVGYFISVMRDLELLDYARRYFERNCDRSSMRRAQRIRKLDKQTIRDHREWNLSFNASNHPNNNYTDEKCASGQKADSPVWFLVQP